MSPGMFPGFAGSVCEVPTGGPGLGVVRAQDPQLGLEQVAAGNRIRTKGNGQQMIRTVKCATLSPGIGFQHATQAIQITRTSRPAGAGSWYIEAVYVVSSLPTD